MDARLLIRCLTWDRDGELCPNDRDQIVSVLQSSDSEAAPALSELRAYSSMPTAA